MTANAGYHLFSTGDVLTAAQVQYNLQNQTIMYFASSAARTSALSGVVVEGMFSYLADTNSTEYYDGAAWQSISNPGDITAVTTTAPLQGGGTSGAIALTVDAASTSASGVVQLSNSTSTTSSVLAATPTAVKSAYDLANAAIPKTLTTTTGDIIYASGANTPARLGIGSSAQILTVSGGIPAWSTPAASGSYTKIVGNTFSSSSGITEDGCFTSTYKSYKLVITAYNSTRGEWIKLRYRVGASTQTNASFLGGRLLQDTTGNIFQSVNGVDGANVVIMENLSYAQSSCELMIAGVGTGGNIYPLIQGTIVSAYWNAAGTQGYVFQQQIAVTGFNLAPTAGTMTGYYTLYGLAY